MTTIVVLGSRYPDFSLEQEILGNVEIVSAPGVTADEIVDIAGNARIIISGSLPEITADVFPRLPKLEAIVRAGIGVDNIDLDAARAAGIGMCSIPDYGTETVAQHTLAMSLAAIRRLGEADRIVRDGGWGFDPLRPIHVPGEMTAGVVGFGRIGRRVAGLMLLVGFGRLVAHDPYADPDAHGVEPATLEKVLLESDVVCLHAHAPPDRPLIGADELALMKPESVIVNTSRGALIDDAALAEALKAGAPRVAALDVFSPEPPDLSVFDGVTDRLLLSPHMAWYTEESQREMRRKSAIEARRILDGHEPQNPIVTPEPAT